MKNPEPLFPLGRVRITPRAGAAIRAAYDKSEGAACLLLLRHAIGDWSEMDSEDRMANEAALREGDYILSGYDLRPLPGENQGQRVWVLTGATRRATTVLLPDEDFRL